MAGEWLKFDANTPEKPEVFAITAKMGWDDPDLAVGKLLRVWRWFDQHTIDGNAPNVTLSLLDRVAGVSGFAQTMCDVGWLLELETGLQLPNFERHNGKTAKDRVLTAKRVAAHKARTEETNAETVSPGVTPSVSEALPRAEQSQSSIDKNKKKTRARSGEGFSLTDELRSWALKNVPSVDVEAETVQFLDHHAAKGTVFKNWEAGWRTWMRNAVKFAANDARRNSTGKSPPKTNNFKPTNDFEQQYPRDEYPHMYPDERTH